MLTWESKQILGSLNITQHLVDLPFGKVQHKIVTTDAQPSATGSENMIVLVTGQLIVRLRANSLHIVSFTRNRCWYLTPDFFLAFVDRRLAPPSVLASLPARQGGRHLLRLQRRLPPVRAFGTLRLQLLCVC